MLSTGNLGARRNFYPGNPTLAGLACAPDPTDVLKYGVGTGYSQPHGPSISLMAAASLGPWLINEMKVPKKRHLGVEMKDSSAAKWLRFTSWLCRLVGVWPWAEHLTSWGLGLCICSFWRPLPSSSVPFLCLSRSHPLLPDLPFWKEGSSRICRVPRPQRQLEGKCTSHRALQGLATLENILWE